MARGKLTLAGIAILFALLVGCSPEADRSRAGGPGADIGNRSTEVQLHGERWGEPSIYLGTPVKVSVGAEAEE